jgi:branched-chain amino acid transport system substrate-binding protein
MDNVFCAEGGTPIARSGAGPGSAWRTRYDARFPAQFLMYSAYTYDATMVLVDAMTRAGSTDPVVYGPQLLATNYQGLVWRIAFEADGEMKNPPMTLYGFKDGKKTALD